MNNFAKMTCDELHGVGDKLSQALSRAGIDNVFMLLLQLPYRYQDRTRITPLNRLQDGTHVLIQGRIEHAEVSFRRRKMLLVYVNDGNSILLLRFFKFFKSQQTQLAAGTMLRCFGQVRQSGLQFEMVHPEYNCFHESDLPPLDEYLTPIYSAVKGVQPLVLRKLIRHASEKINNDTQDYLPDEIRQKHSLVNIWQALQMVHCVKSSTAILAIQSNDKKLKRRLAFDELLAHQLSLENLREQYQKSRSSICKTDEKLKNSFTKALHFTLTNAQARVLHEIESDLAKNKPMMRLVQGDVGSGKTVVAAMSALAALSQGLQVAIMAPTEILAGQHFKKFQQWFEPLGFHVVQLLSKLKAKPKREVLAEISEGQAKVIIGTHALFQKQVGFKNLGLVIIDEQHRFGVHQRLSLRDKGVADDLHPHQLIMTATPIPRTLAMCAYADLDQSVIDELPPGRKAITTIAIDNTRRDQVIQRIESICASGRQVYWVCTLVEASEVLQCEACENTFELLKLELPGLNIGIIHGRLSSEEKQKTMQEFLQEKIDVLVATTVIEVGVDVPNASLMIIENAERLGLSQLHQLRGRIGRGEFESYCALLFKSPLGQTAKARIKIMRETQDGFKVAERDLAMRGPGEFLGTRQAGSLEFQFADIEDENLVCEVKQVVADNLSSPIIENLFLHWQAKRDRYAQV